MKRRRAEYRGQNAGTEVSRDCHESVTVMDSLGPVERRGGPASRQRAQAEARGAFARVGARTEPQRLFETGGLRWRFPRSSSPCEAAIVNTGGGVAGGDSLSREPRRSAKAPRSRRPRRRRRGSIAATARRRASRPRLSLAPGARLFWLPQETLLFEGAALERRLDVELAADAVADDRRSRGVRPPGLGETGSTPAARLAGEFAATAGWCSPTRRGSTDAGAALDRTAVGAGARALTTIVARRPIARPGARFAGGAGGRRATASKPARAPSTA